MYPWKPIVLASLAAVAVQAAVVYKWTDAAGVVHYSDQAVPGAEKIFTAGSPNTGGGSSGSRSSAPAQVAAPVKQPAPSSLFTQMTITSPTAEQSFFNDELIVVHLALQPDLQPNQSVTWYLNGKPLQEDAGATQFSMKNLDRGTYTLTATVVDQDSGQSQNADNVIFYMHQPSALAPQRQRR